MFSLYSITYLIIFINISNAQLNITYLGKNVFQEDDNCGECCQQYKELDMLTYLKMVDSSTKFTVTGLLYGNFWDLGSYDECLSIQNEQEEIFGKYCLGYLPFQQLITEDNIEMANTLALVRKTKKKLRDNDIFDSGNPSLSGLHFGICVPNQCSATQLADIYPSLSFTEKLCSTKAEKTNLTTGALLALILIGVMLLITIISTIYDMVYEYKDIGPKNMALVVFSMYTNGKSLVRISKNPDQLLCINGIKAISMLWVILGHVYYNFTISVAITNWASVSDWIDNPVNMIVMSGALSVDTFFLVGGLLLVYTYMKTPKKQLNQSLKSVPLTYLHRYVRLTPALAVMVLVYATGLITYISDGPRWGTMHDLLTDTCEKKWWATILYVQNYDKVENLCVSQSWYLSVDMQLFLIAQLILIFLRQWPKLGIYSLILLSLLASVISFIVGYTNELTGFGKGPILPTMTSDYYYMTHVRYGPYVIGMLFGYYIYKMKNREKPLKFGTWPALALWAVIFVALLACIFGGFKLLRNTDNEVVDGLYFGLNRTMWSCALGFLIIMCISGNGGPINWFLSHPIFQLITKLSYSIYLVHYLVINVGNFSARETFTFNNMNAVFQFFAYSVITILLSVFYCLIFEYPIMIIWKIIFGKPRSEKK